MCHVPGTLRKNPLIWKRWAASGGNQLHALQLQICTKGVRLLQVGGRLAYSTCSMNPVENEAVVAGVLRTFGPGCVLRPNPSPSPSPSPNPNPNPNPGACRAH
jgi:16S rRNA C967 or C1407 C5-methylase (RsmB/RsmF family)